MILTNTWKVEFEHELARAMQARAVGNEGMARVCARRAAGIVVGEYLSRRGHRGLNDSAYDRITLFSGLPDVDEAHKRVGRHFLMKVSHEHDLPVKADLIQEAAWLKDQLLGDRKD